MRLLDTRKLQTPRFQTFDDERTTPPYAILSHTWGEDEVTFQDISQALPGHQLKNGYDKILRCVQQAHNDGYRYCWIDTCCIDKTSSSELSEAINSMFRWYRNAKVCYIYLAKTRSLPDETRLGPRAMTDWFDEFRACKWFTRGWTLQELIAPRRCVFFSQDWQSVGTKESLQHEIRAVTGIPISILIHGKVFEMSIAQRMSWAAKRKTTRIEDQAYCLMGLFEVNMPLLYGEGDRAFVRLQEEIMKVSDDMSLFTWRDASSRSQFSTCSGLLATSAAFFETCAHVPRPLGRSNEPFWMTNKGLRITVRLIEQPAAEGEYIAILPNIRVWHGDSGSRRLIGLHLARVDDDSYVRVDVGKLWDGDASLEATAQLTTLYVPQRLSGIIHRISPNRATGVFLDLGLDPWRLVSVQPANLWDQGQLIFFFRRQAMTDEMPDKMVLLFQTGDATMVEMEISIERLFDLLQSQSRMYDGVLQSIGSVTGAEAANVRISAQMNIGGTQVVIHLRLLRLNYGS